MANKRRQTDKEEKPFSNKKAVLISAILVVTIISGVVLSRILITNPEVDFSFKAGIIDQIGTNFPSNQESAQRFNLTASDLMETAGFNVSYHKAESVRVNLFKDLAKYNYGLIILRTHSALREDEPKVDLFTSELYSENKYVDEQNNGLLTRGYYVWDNRTYFSITPEFIKSIDGSFPKSIVVAMGCSSLKPGYETMAEAFCEKGAAAYIGWTAEVGIDHSDNETIKLLELLLEQNKTIAEAVSMISPDFSFSMSEMKFYPPSAGNTSINTLTAKTNTSMLSQMSPWIVAQLSPIYVIDVVGLQKKKTSKPFSRFSIL